MLTIDTGRLFYIESRFLPFSFHSCNFYDRDIFSFAFSSFSFFFFARAFSQEPATQALDGTAPTVLFLP